MINDNDYNIHVRVYTASDFNREIAMIGYNYIKHILWACIMTCGLFTQGFPVQIVAKYYVILKFKVFHVKIIIVPVLAILRLEIK